MKKDVILIVIFTLVVFAAWMKQVTAADDCAKDVSDVRTRFVIAWAHVHAGEPLDDMDLQAFSDANDALICLENRGK